MLTFFTFPTGSSKGGYAMPAGRQVVAIAGDRKGRPYKRIGNDKIFLAY
ncbi:hypothetical protein KKC08_04065 [Patescibacteria group bacterium]|nr:hypothetical protein [Patescibacteria group bacterium]MBU4579052.1 hypothetical protein [Patescibacteria group bacterium]